MAEQQNSGQLVRRALGALNWCLDKAVTSLNALGTLIIIALMILICSDVISRNVFANSIPGVIELAELAIVSIVFLQIADTLKTGKLMRSDAIIGSVRRAYPRVGISLNIAFDAVGAVLFYFLAVAAFDRFLKAWSGGFYLGNLGSFTAPTWPMELCVALGSGLVCILFGVQALKGCAAFAKGETIPPDGPAPGSEYDL